MKREPYYTCEICGRIDIVRQGDGEFPPDRSKRRLQRRCATFGCECDPIYTAGVMVGPQPSGQSVLPPTPTEDR